MNSFFLSLSVRNCWRRSYLRWQWAEREIPHLLMIAGSIETVVFLVQGKNAHISSSFIFEFISPYIFLARLYPINVTPDYCYHNVTSIQMWLFSVQFWEILRFIQRRNLLIRANTVYCLLTCAKLQFGEPQLTAPCRTNFPDAESLQTNGPPLSPWQPPCDSLGFRFPAQTICLVTLSIPPEGEAESFWEHSALETSGSWACWSLW